MRSAGGPHAVNDGAFVRTYDDYKLRCVGLIGRRRARRRKQDMTVCTVGLCPGAIATGSAPQTHTHALLCSRHRYDSDDRTYTLVRSLSFSPLYLHTADIW